MGSVLMLCVTSWNDESASAVAGSHSPQTAKALFPLRGEQARMAVFYITNEATRSYGTVWEVMQFVIGLATAGALFLERRTRLYTIAIAVMLLVVIFEWLVILPHLGYLGSSIDMVPWNTSSAARDQYWNLRAVFIGMETLKLLLGAGLTGALLVIRTRSRSQSTDLPDPVLTTGERSERRRKSRAGSREHTTRT